jgi:hypothetical protein
MSETPSDDPPMAGPVVDDVMAAPGPPEVTPDRREHGGAPFHLDDDALAERTEQERVDAGLEDYNPDDVPPATDDPVPSDITESDEYQEELAEVQREVKAGEVVLEDGDQELPPTSYDRT